ncbi:PREDICTED: DELTA-thalatoxin-Avl2a-like [Acropora digitifera]|uniref:DELTA-thalatoxin-Avl2a-like n=1 Tax=Acropora digitifera TaxID=70779 RepID=UPI00077A1789|nr:PREDICTED: DELTA-thalatoxin-Avl2a-like [Acropora digitifera]
MIVPLILVIHLTALSVPSARGIEDTLTTSETQELGKVINLGKTNLLEDFKEKETSIFEAFPSECFRKEKLNITRSLFEYYKSTKAFYSKLATQAGLDVSLQSAYSLSASLNSVTHSTSSSESKVSGISLIVEALTEKIHLNKDCLIDESFKLKQSFMDKLERLPLKIDEPWERNSWRPYKNFLDDYGSHVVTSVKRGVRIKQMSFSRSSKSYSERDFQVKSCVSFAGPTSVGKVGVSACANISKSESSKASDMSTTNKLLIRGGSRETRSQLLHDRSKGVIQQLMNEAADTHSSVQHTFRAIWKVLQSRFPGSPNYVRGLNLQYYYLGFLNYGCPYVKGGEGNNKVQIQKFDYTERSSDKYPEFECSLAKEGCHSNEDCHYKPIWCSCRGPTCVHYKTEELDTGASKESAYANTGEDWGWKGCDWKIAGSWCECYNEHRDWRKVVWSLPSKDYAARKSVAHHGARRQAKDSGHGKPTGKEERL